MKAIPPRPRRRQHRTLCLPFSSLSLLFEITVTIACSQSAIHRRRADVLTLCPLAAMNLEDSSTPHHHISFVLLQSLSLAIIHLRSPSPLGDSLVLTSFSPITPISLTAREAKAPLLIYSDSVHRGITRASTVSHAAS